MPPPELPCAVRELNLRDPRPPQDVQAALEREFMTPLRPAIVDGLLEYTGAADVNGATCFITLRLLAVHTPANAYQLRLTFSWGSLPAEAHDYHQRTAGSWLDLWTRELTNGPAATPQRSEAYDRLAAHALAEEARFSSAESIQAIVLEAVRDGATFHTSHKEGGTVISWRHGRFVRQDFGESDTSERFSSDPDFLAFLRRFFEWETQRHIPGGAPTEPDRWRLIARLLQRD